MDGYFAQALKALGGEPRALWGSFAPNGSSDPDSASNTGPAGLRSFTVDYEATGKFTVTLPEGMHLPANASIVAFAQAADLASYFEVLTIGNYSSSTRSFVIQAKRAGAAYEPAAATGTRIHFVALFNNSTGA